jgi:hypothetical protein
MTTSSRTFSPAHIPPPPSEYQLVFKRAGWLLLASAAIDILWPMLVGTFEGTPFREIRLSLPFLTIIIAIFLLRGNLRMASIFRWCLAFSLAASVTSIFLDPVSTPIGLRFAQWRFDFLKSFGAAALALVTIAAGLWIVWQLGSAPVNAARAAQGRPWRRLHLPVALGVILTVIAAVFAVGTANSPGQELALQQARTLVGPGYDLHVGKISSKRKSGVTNTRAKVTAWNDSEIKVVEVGWQQ